MRRDSIYGRQHVHVRLFHRSARAPCRRLVPDAAPGSGGRRAASVARPGRGVWPPLGGCRGGAGVAGACRCRADRRRRDADAPDQPDGRAIISGAAGSAPCVQLGGRSRPAPLSDRHRSEQNFTCSQSRAHFLRHANDSPHAAHRFVGRSPLRTIFGIDRVSSAPARLASARALVAGKANHQLYSINLFIFRSRRHPAAAVDRRVVTVTPAALHAASPAREKRAPSCESARF